MASAEWLAGFCEAIEFACGIECAYCKEGRPWRWNELYKVAEHPWGADLPRTCWATRIRKAAAAATATASAGDGAGSEG